MTKKNTIRLSESELMENMPGVVNAPSGQMSEYQIKHMLDRFNYYYNDAMECFNDNNSGFPKKAVTTAISLAKKLIPYKKQRNDIKQVLMKAKQLSNLAKRELEIMKNGYEIANNEGGMAYLDYLDSVGKIPTVNLESKNMNRKNTIRLTESELKRVITESVKKVLKEDAFYPDELYGTGASWDGVEDTYATKVPIRFGEENRSKFNKITTQAYSLVSNLKFYVATEEQRNELLHALKLIRHACIGR